MLFESAELDLRDLDPNDVSVTWWHPRRVMALKGFVEAGNDLSRGYELTLSHDQKLTLLTREAGEPVVRDCHIVHHSDLSVPTLTLSFDYADDMVMTVLLIARQFNGQEEWFLGTKALVLPSRDPLPWSSAIVELDDGGEDDVSMQRGGRIHLFIGLSFINDWFGEQPIVPVGDVVEPVVDPEQDAGRAAEQL
jgi:hypothetical protein